jgi:hypothetical protein
MFVFMAVPERLTFVTGVVMVVMFVRVIVHMGMD